MGQESKEKNKENQMHKSDNMNFYILNKQHEFVCCNDEQAKVFGFENSKKVIGKSLYDLYPKKVAYKMIANNLLVMDTQLSHTFKEEMEINGLIRNYTSEKKPFLVDNQVFGVMGVSEEKVINSMTKTPVFQDQRSLEKFVGQSVLELTSLTQRVSGEIKAGVSIEPIEYLVRIHNFFENLMASIPVNVYWMNLDNKYLGCNNHYVKLRKLSHKHEIMGKTNREIHSMNYNIIDPKIIDRNNIEVMNAGVIKTFEEKDKNADGELINYHSSKAPLFNEAGRTVGMIGTSFPLTH